MSTLAKQSDGTGTGVGASTSTGTSTSTRTAAPQVFRAERDDAERLSEVVAAAFLNLAPSLWLIQEEEVRRELFPEYFRLYVDEAFAHGTVYTNADRTAAALWLTKPAAAEPPEAAEAAAYDRRLAAITGARLNRFLQFDAALERHHPTGTEHHHLAILGVHPDVQRTGIGSALLAEHHRFLDDAQIPAFLEASDAGTREIYLRHGYQDRGSPIHISEEGPLMYPMWRDPAK